MNAQAMTQSPQELRDALFARVAKYVTLAVPTDQIARAVGLSVTQLEQVLTTVECRNLVADLQTEVIEKSDLLNRGWDGLEDMAVSAVWDAVKNNPDPGYALSVATAANKAIRRGHTGNRPLDANMPTTVVLQLSSVYIEKLQQMNGGQTHVNIDASNSKRVDTMNAGDVERIMLSDEGQDIADAIFDDIARADLAKHVTQGLNPYAENDGPPRVPGNIANGVVNDIETISTYDMGDTSVFDAAIVKSAVGSQGRIEFSGVSGSQRTRRLVHQ